MCNVTASVIISCYFRFMAYKVPIVIESYKQYSFLFNGKTIWSLFRHCIADIEVRKLIFKI